MSEYSTNCKYTASDYTASDVKWLKDKLITKYDQRKYEKFPKFKILIFV